ncbi:hypothetical protein SELMODRAFT_423317 [Selaginella moellendorffii]|uniref:Uncharacterized protein n=1 Tax=Selaginella moellendorffii TaxID=88036 RepID=D8SLA0_SELML|nr:hypothetical protein SELMODRAFT_423317 [Selaginella moellendorffii]
MRSSLQSTSELQSAIREDLKLLPVLEAGTTTRIKVLEAGTKRKRKKFHPQFTSVAMAGTSARPTMCTSLTLVLEAGTRTRIKVFTLLLFAILFRGLKFLFVPGARGWNQEKKKKISPTVRFSGYSRDECQTNDVHVFDFGMYTWSKPVMKGTHPSPRDNHSSTAVGSKLYVFGDTNGTSPLNNLFVLDNETMAWREVKTTGAELMPRAGHTTISHGKYLASTGVWATLNPSGSRPAPRFSLAGDSVDAERGILFVFEGCNKELEALDDMYFLDTEFQAHIQPLGKKMFEARESDVFNYGYTLEASIDGKLFRGLLFLYKPGFAQAVQTYMASIFARRLIIKQLDLKLDNILSKLNMRDKVVSTFRRYHHSEVHGS